MLYTKIKKDRIKAKKLYKKLFIHLKKKAFENKLENSDIKLRISNTFGVNGSYCQEKSTKNFYGEVTKKRYTISISLYSLKNQTTKYGYSSSYYSARPERLLFLKHNRKKSLYFVILHELYHAYQRIYNIPCNNTSWHNDREYQADTFAIENLDKIFNTEKKTIEIKQKTCRACGKTLDIRAFRVYKGVRVLNVCKTCERQKARARTLIPA